MSRFKKYVGVALLVGIVAALGISSVASAQSSVTPTPTAPIAPGTPPERGGFGGRGGLHSQAALEAAAKALGMTTDELSAQLWGGKTLADIAEEKGVDIADVKAAVEAVQIAETKTAIAQAVTDGTITQAKADWLLEGLNKGYWGAGQDGFGFGMGPGMGHGGPRGGGPMGTPPNGTPPSNNNGNGDDSTTPSGSTS
ncbi:MAG TPA: hypothetical protein VLG46_15610 [Anaerolineae bacterium]|nr:hypothetical protein [Anaerolineae bacterium]